MPLAEGVFAASYLAVPASVGAARKAVRGVLRSWGADCLIDDVMVVTSEIVSNAVEHTMKRAPTTPIGVRFLWNDGSPLLEVSDPLSVTPVMQSTAAYAVSGRGLHIVAMLAQDWGSYPTPAGGKVVWARFDLDTKKNEQ